jgi:hypothetical protein
VLVRPYQSPHDRHDKRSAAADYGAVPPDLRGPKGVALTSRMSPRTTRHSKILCGGTVRCAHFDTSDGSGRGHR